MTHNQFGFDAERCNPNATLSNRDLALELKQAFEIWGCVESTMLTTLSDPAHWATYAHRFRGGYTEALEVAYADQFAQAQASISAKLRTTYLVEPFEGGLLIDRLLHVKFQAAWPRARVGRLHWEFHFLGTETEDVTIGLCFSPPPDVRHVETYVLHTSKFTKRKQTVGVSLCGKGPKRFVHIKDTSHLLRTTEYAIYWRNKRAERQLLLHLQACTVINLARVARDLGWKANTVRVMYKRLIAQGELLPARARHQGARITVICGRCKKTRAYPPQYGDGAKNRSVLRVQPRSRYPPRERYLPALRTYPAFLPLTTARTPGRSRCAVSALRPS